MHEYENAKIVAQSIAEHVTDTLEKRGITLTDKECADIYDHALWETNRFECASRRNILAETNPLAEITILPMTSRLDIAPLILENETSLPVSLVIVNCELDPIEERWAVFELNLPTITDGWVVFDLTAIDPALNEGVRNCNCHFCLAKIEDHKITDDDRKIRYLADDDITPEIWAAHVAHFKAHPWLITQNSSTDKATQAKYLAELEK